MRGWVHLNKFKTEMWRNNCGFKEPGEGSIPSVSACFENNDGTFFDLQSSNSYCRVDLNLPPFGVVCE